MTASPEVKAWRLFIWPFLAALLISNAAAFVVAYRDMSWGALGIQIMTGPILNACFLVAGAIGVGLMKVREHWKRWVVFGSPIAINTVLFWSILFLPLHGC